MLRPDSITKREAEATLLRYKPLLQAISGIKSASSKDDDESLEDLDWFRFVTAPNRYMKRDGDEADVPLEKDDVVRLVKWKLKHGKFRPNLLKLASSNSSSSIRSTSLTAFGMNTTIASMKTLALLSGIGPATASLLLSVHDPERVLFFSDEAYRWLCCGGKESPIKYNWKEYMELEQKANALMARLEIGARDVERLAFVIMRGGTVPLANETANDLRRERTAGSRKSGDAGRSSSERDMAETAPLKKLRTSTSKKSSRSNGRGKDIDSETISSGVGSLEMEKIDEDKARLRHLALNLPSTHGLRPKSPSLRASERSRMAIAQQKIIPEDQIKKAFEANARKIRPKSSRTAAEERKKQEKRSLKQEKSTSSEEAIPDAKTLARKASQRLLEGQPALERPKTEETKRLDAVVEDLKERGSRIGRVISPPPLRFRGHEKGSQSESPESRVSVLPTSIRRQRDGSKFSEQIESGRGSSERDVDGKSAAELKSMKRTSSEQKSKSPEPQTAASKRPRRSTRRQAEADTETLASVNCSGCLNLGRSRS